jgi:hypothetical protein
MTTIEVTINALIQTKAKIKEYQMIINGLRKQEKELVKEIQSYLNERNEQGVKVDDNTYITMASHEKKINLNKKDYQKRVRHLLYSRGIEDEDFTIQLLNKTSDVVQEQKIKINKEK